MPDENQVGDAQTTPAADTEPVQDTAAEQPAKKTAAKKTAAKKTAAKKPATKKAAAKAPAKKSAAKKTAAKTDQDADQPLPLDPEAPVAAVKKTTRTRKSATPKPDTDAAATPVEESAAEAPAPAKRSSSRKPAKKAAAAPAPEAAGSVPEASPADAPEAPVAAEEAPEKPTRKPAKKSAAKPTKKSTSSKAAASTVPDETAGGSTAGTDAEPEGATGDETSETAAAAAVPLFQAPDATKATKATKNKGSGPEQTPAPDSDDSEDLEGSEDSDDTDDEGQDGGDGSGSSGRRRRRRGGRRRRRGGSGGQGGSSADGDDQGGNGQGGSGQAGSNRDRDGETAEGDDSADEGDGQGGKGDSGQGDGSGEGGGSSRRRRRRRRSGDSDGDSGDDPANTVTKVRSSRTGEDQITALSGSTRLEAKKQRRREGREAGRRRAPIVSEAEFLARRESVERVMVIREREDLTQIGVLEDKVLVEHYVARESQTSLIGNVYLGRVQNVLPSMEAAFIDIGKGRNAVLYAGEVNWSALGHKEGQPRKIESVLSSGQSVLVQVTKDPVGHKGARLTSQVSLAGRFLVYVPDGTTSGISRKLPDTERSRLKALLKEIVPDTAGVIVRTAAEGASEDELTRDVERLKARWEDIEKKAKGSAPQLLYGEPDLTLKVVRDLFTEDFSKLVIQGNDAWDTVQSYVTHVAPDLAERLERFEPATEGRDAGKDIFAAYRVDEQIAKGLDRKVWLPSGGSLVIDRTEAMTVVDVNTGKFTGSGGNLEETVTKNNLEAAEEIVRQLRLRDIGGIIVFDFIDMVLESNRDLVLRRLVECLGRDRTRHQVAEVTSLGLVQMTRKRIGTGLLEAFSENCTHCQGRGVVVHDQPVEPKRGSDDDDRGGRSKRSRGGRGKGSDNGQGSGNQGSGNQGPGGQNSGGQNSGGSGNQGSGGAPSPKDVAAMARPDATSPVETPTESVTAPADDSAQKSAEKPDQQQAEKSVEQPARTSGKRTRQATGGVEETTAPSEDRAEPAPVAADPAAAGAERPESGGVVTRTRRSARRTAPLTTGEAAAVVVDPATQPAAPAPVQETSSEAPKVVTRTRSSRGRSAAAPSGTQVPTMAEAGQPTGVGEPPASGTVEPGTAGIDPDDAAAETDSGAPQVEHVPVKRKGSRKR